MAASRPARAWYVPDAPDRRVGPGLTWEPQARLSRFLQGCRFEPFTEQQARAAGRALGASEGRDLIDAAVVVGALARGDLVVSSDPDNLRRIAAAIGRELAVHAV